MYKFLASVALILAFSVSCSRINALIHDEDVVAKVGKYKLYRSQLEAYIPSGSTPEDSTNLAQQYINSWANELVFMHAAESQLSKDELDVSSELEDFRRSLLKFRYEQRYVNDRLDTLITDSEIENYYNSHKEIFALERPVMKVRFIDIMKDSPEAADIIAKMTSTREEDQRILDSLAYASSLRYFNSSDKWMDAAVLAREFGTDYVSMLAAMDKDGKIRMEPEGRGDVRVMHVVEILKSGTAPLEYCADKIRDVLLSSRKHELVSNLERDLLKDALDRGNFVIY